MEGRMNYTNCWYCGALIAYDGEMFKDVDCSNCGCENSIYNSADYKPYEPDGSERKVVMGKLADRAREKSPYLRLEIGEETLPLIYKSWKEATDNFGNDTFRYFFDLETETGLVTKQFDNRSQSFAEALDKINFGEKVILKREPKLDPEGEPLENKSIWTVRKVE
ncbi:MAG: hypothetical protein H8D26_03630 [Methanomicrobia archaeon]|nr:hypothetical protein [Methanomicrobia archaeon]